MKDNFAKCLPEILRHEGLWSDHPDDPGGATMKGITIGTYAQWKGRKVTKAELRAIPDSEVAAIYKRNYWDKVKGDDLPAGLDLVAFDAAVNSGPSRGARWLQQALGVSEDGQIGPATLAAARKQYGPAVIERAIGYRLAFLRQLKTWKTFGKGWSARLEGVRVKALEMARSPIDLPDSFPETPVKKPSKAPAAVGVAGIITATIYAAWDTISAWWHALF